MLEIKKYYFNIFSNKKNLYLDTKTHSRINIQAYVAFFLNKNHIIF
jgi:hypothetical protein